MNELVRTLDKLNVQLAAAGMLRLALVNPTQLHAQEKNARKMKRKTLRLLTDNIKSAGHLESMPLVYEDPELPKGEYYIISGHHRVKAALDADIDAMLVMVAEVSSREEVASKQLAHNAVVGKDKGDVLAEIYGDIQALELQIASGLYDQMTALPEEAEPVQYQEFVLACLPADLQAYRNLMTDLEALALGSGITSMTDEVQVADIGAAAPFAEMLKRIKGAEKVKANWQAFKLLVQYAKERYHELHG